MSQTQVKKIVHERTVNIKTRYKTTKSRVCLDILYCWKHCNKIIFKCMNNVVRPNFDIVFAEKSTCGSYK